MTQAKPRSGKTANRAGQVITIAQQKGGTGKTTLTIHLAIACLQQGKSVAVIDLDPQASLTRWHRHRVAGFGESEGLTHRQTSGWRVAAELDSLRRDHDLVLLDNPPHAETDLKIAIRGADLLLVPVQLSPADLWAMQATIDLGRAERKDALLVYNRVPPRGRSSQEVRDRIEKSDVEVASTQLGNRIAYSASLMSGLGVTEFAPRSTAAAEITDLASELIERLGRTPRPSSILLPRESRTSIETRPH